jgi:hypothetical protein
MQDAASKLPDVFGEDAPHASMDWNDLQDAICTSYNCLYKNKLKGALSKKTEQVVTNDIDNPSNMAIEEDSGTAQVFVDFGMLATTFCLHLTCACHVPMH